MLIKILEGEIGIQLNFFKCPLYVHYFLGTFIYIVEFPNSIEESPQNNCLIIVDGNINYGAYYKMYCFNKSLIIGIRVASLEFCIVLYKVLTMELRNFM